MLDLGGGLFDEALGKMIKKDEDKNFDIGKVSSTISESTSGEEAGATSTSSLICNPKEPLVTNFGGGFFS